MILDLLTVSVVIFLGLTVLDWLDGASRWERDRRGRR